MAEDVTAATGVKALAVPADIAAKASVAGLVAATEAAFGRVDILVNNAAIDPKFDPQHAAAHTCSFEEYPLELWNQSLQVNLTGMFLCCQAVAAPMLRQRQGSIINIASIYGLVGPDQRLYVNAAGEQEAFKPVASR